MQLKHVPPSNIWGEMRDYKRCREENRLFFINDLEIHQWWQSEKEVC